MWPRIISRRSSPEGGQGRAILALGLALGLVLSGSARAADPALTTRLSLGYDSNPAQRRDGPALGFTQAAVELHYPLPEPFPQGLSLGGEAWWREAAGANDSGRLDLNLAWRGTWGRTQIALWGTGGWYRDQLVPADERHETAVGALFSRALNRRLDLSLLGERRWFAYRHSVLPWAGRPGGHAPQSRHGGGQGQPGAGRRGQGDAFRAQRRADRLETLALDTTWLISARFSLTLGLDQAWRHSSIPLDAYAQQGARLALTCEPYDRLSLMLEAGVAQRDYPHAPRQLERQDHPRWLGLELWHWRERGAWFCTLNGLDSRSTLALEAFTQWVGRCGYQHDF